MKALGLICLLAAGLPPGVPPEAAIVIVPDADGGLDLAGALQARAFDAIPNPFRDRHRPVPPPREVTVAVAAVLIAPGPAAPSAIVNGRLCSVGDSVEGLTITAIAADGLDLRQGDILLRVPVRDPAPRLRLPR